MSLNNAIWLAGLVGESIALFALFHRGAERSLKPLRWFFVLLICQQICTHYFLLHFGYRSHAYAYAYFGSDLATVIFGFFVLAHLVEAAFAQSTLKLPGLRTGAITVFTGLATCSAAVVYLMRGSLSIAHFSIEMEQNFDFLGMLLAVALFVLINLMQVPGVRFRRVVLSFSVFYSTGAIIYSVLAIFPVLSHFMGFYGGPAVNAACILLLAYAVWVPEKALARVQPEAAGPMGLAQWAEVRR